MAVLFDLTNLATRLCWLSAVELTKAESPLSLILSLKPGVNTAEGQIALHLQERETKDEVLSCVAVEVMD